MYTLILSTNILEPLLGIERVKNDDAHKIQSLKLYLNKLTFSFNSLKKFSSLEYIFLQLLFSAILFIKPEATVAQ